MARWKAEQNLAEAERHAAAGLTGARELMMTAEDELDALMHASLEGGRYRENKALMTRSLRHATS